ncbi:S66 family peptidase [Anaerosacchariphilus polymeriproducens]|uniref:LD-carboxypeptidase n=1 Tax=Anaerosacchariphilus polymeriproducens TaxID=1812858 RepID=A0A371ARM6_9FIRM|nr:S66 peptidase family protein [Anaerosacchariphilus polymeriproducens]RDU22231.1 LD-carboxypeptidase [Anaerosacchariphilus polymeriproducens]
MLRPGDKVGIVCCSNGILDVYRPIIENLIVCLRKIGLEPICSDFIFQTNSVFSGTGKERAEALMKFYKKKEIKAIFDISGGDLANELLHDLDFEQIKNNPKPFWGYSDLTTIINAIYAKTGQVSYLYQIRNLISEFSWQIKNFCKLVFQDKKELLEFQYQFLQGKQMQGVVIGGNIRCFLKLAGTPYMPEFKDKILFLESRGGEVAQMTTYLNQLKQMGVFREIRGILLGTFLTMEEQNCIPTIQELVMQTVENVNIPIAKTEEIGHRKDSKCLIIGKEIHLGNSSV